MTIEVVLLRSAEQDLRDLRSYILKTFGKETWHSSYRKIKESVNVIKIFPESGSVPEELANLNIAHYRQCISGKNRIIYEVRQDAIYIHVVCDTRKDMKALLLKRILGASHS